MPLPDRSFLADSPLCCALILIGYAVELADPQLLEPCLYQGLGRNDEYTPGHKPAVSCLAANSLTFTV